MSTPNVVMVLPRARHDAAASAGMSPMPVPTSSSDTVHARICVEHLRELVLHRARAAEHRVRARDVRERARAQLVVDLGIVEDLVSAPALRREERAHLVVTAPIVA